MGDNWVNLGRKHIIEKFKLGKADLLVYVAKVIGSFYTNNVVVVALLLVSLSVDVLLPRGLGKAQRIKSFGSLHPSQS